MQNSVKGLTVLPADIRLAGAEIELANMERRERVIADMLEGVREQFDYIFIDCPPSLGMITLNALCAADGVLIPIQCEYFALEGVSALMGTIQKVQKMNRHLAIEGVVLTMLDARTNLGVQVAQEVRKVFKNKVYQTVIPRNVRLGEAPSHGLPISLYDPRSLGAQSYQQLAKSFGERIKKGKNRHGEENGIGQGPERYPAGCGRSGGIRRSGERGRGTRARRRRGGNPGRGDRPESKSAAQTV